MIADVGRHAVMEGTSSEMIADVGRHAVMEGTSSWMIADGGRPATTEAPGVIQFGRLLNRAMESREFFCR
ncbi:MAG: hypothetical protein V4850_20450 [Myxococcota bacterium]